MLKVAFEFPNWELPKQITASGNFDLTYLDLRARFWAYGLLSTCFLNAKDMDFEADMNGGLCYAQLEGPASMFILQVARYL